MSMIEKMARAMAEALDGYPYKADEEVVVDHINAAKAALRVLLEPSQAMIKAGKPWAGVSGNSSRKTIVAAIQAALDEK